MKIAQITCTYPPYRGGIGNVVYSQTELLRKAGHDVDVYTPLYSRREESNSFVKRLKPLLSFGNAAVLPQLFFKLRKYDVVYLHYPFFGTAELLFLMKFILRYKFRLYIHYHMDTQSMGFFRTIMSWPAKAIEASLFRVAEKVTCASLDYVGHGNLSRIYKKNKRKFIEIPFSVDEEKFKPSEREVSKNIGFVGGMDKAHNFKGVDVLVEAFSKMDDKQALLHLVGSGDLLPDYKRLVRKKGLEKRVFFYDKVDNDELPGKYQSFDLFVLPSINSHEAFGIVLLEAMSTGVPVVATKLRGVRKVFDDGAQGLYVEPGDVIGLKNCLDNLLKDKGTRIAMAESARELVLKKYSQKINDKKLKELFVD